ncbi:MAG: SH3 domain-containing protein [Anaerolineae bacterium]|nr:SH3 domain-containing protein [Anaerolineae bacterium]
MKISKTFLTLLFTLLILSQPTMAGWPKILAQTSPPVLAFYYAWFDQDTWRSGQSADLPAEPYRSANRTTIERHVAQAQGAGINAFVQSWYGPQETNNQTETNFRTLLDVAQATDFKAAVDVETTSPFFGDAAAVTQALTTLLTTHAQHPAYLRYQNKPVIFFWRQQQFSVDEWAAIRSQVDPDHNSYWIAEGVDITYQTVFDGHHLYSVAWAASPAEQLAKWGNLVRNYEAENQVERLWVATAMPGYDDTRLPRENAFAVPRRNGDYYRETWQGAIASQPEMIIITSFNEWPEGTQLEPSQSYGNLYLELTRELVTDLRGAPPAAPAALALAQTQVTPETPPEGPYVKVDFLTNIRQGPDTSFAKIGELPAGSLAPVVGRTEASDWWQIEFAGGPEGKGWVSAEVVEFVGEAADVPLVETPPAAETSEPEAGEPSTAAETTPSAEETPALTGAPPRVQIPAGGVNVRSGPGLNFDLVGRLESGVSAVVVAKNETGDWWQIEYQAGENGLAWVADVVVDFGGDSSAVPVADDAAGVEAGTSPAATVTPTPAEPVIEGSVEATDPVNVRSEPSLEGTLVGGLYPGDTADVLAISQDGQWWQIEFADGPEGQAWVAAEFVQFRGDQNTVPIFGLGTPTPTPGPTDTPTPTLPPPTPTPIDFPPTFAPTATSLYEATSAAALAGRGTPDPALTEIPASRSFNWGAWPWGLLAVGVVGGLLWYQFSRYRRRKKRPRL